MYEVEFQRSGDLVGEELTDRTAGDRTDQAAQDEAVGDRVVAVLCAWPPPGPLLLDEPQHRIERGSLVVADRYVQGGDPGSVREHQANRDVLLAVLVERRPVTRHRLVEIEQSAIDQDQHCGRCQSLAGRADGSDGVFSPGQAASRISRTAPDPDYRIPIEIDANRATDIPPALQLSREGIGNPPKGALAVTLHSCNVSDHPPPARNQLQ